MFLISAALLDVWFVLVCRDLRVCDALFAGRVVYSLLLCIDIVEYVSFAYPVGTFFAGYHLFASYSF